MGEQFKDFYVLAGTIGASLSGLSLLVLPLIVDKLREKSLVITVWTSDFILAIIAFSFFPSLYSLTQLANGKLDLLIPSLLAAQIALLTYVTFIGIGLLAIVLRWLKREAFLLIVPRIVLSVYAYLPLSVAWQIPGKKDQPTMSLVLIFVTLFGAIAVLAYANFSVIELGKEPKAKKLSTGKTD